MMISLFWLVSLELLAICCKSRDLPVGQAVLDGKTGSEAPGMSTGQVMAGGGITYYRLSHPWKSRNTQSDMFVNEHL